MGSSLYHLVFGKKKTQKQIEELVDSVMTEREMSIDGGRRRFRKGEAISLFTGTMPAHSEIKYHSWALSTIVTLLIPEKPQNRKGYHVAVEFYNYDEYGREPDYDAYQRMGRKLYSPREILDALTEVAFKTREPQ